MGARGVSSEHVENMEMFSCSPKRYSDITAQSHVIGQETKFRDLIFILLFGHPIAYPYLMWESGDSVSLLLEIKSSMLRNAWDS